VQKGEQVQRKRQRREEHGPKGQRDGGAGSHGRDRYSNAERTGRAIQQ
jgi:hypothetical protein